MLKMYCLGTPGIKKENYFNILTKVVSCMKVIQQFYIYIISLNQKGVFVSVEILTCQRAFVLLAHQCLEELH